MKKAKKQILGLTEASLIGTTGSVAIGAMGGSAAGISNAMRFAPAMGSMIGTGMMMQTIKQLEPKTKRRKRR